LGDAVLEFGCETGAGADAGYDGVGIETVQDAAGGDL
jgi:hypothetical protein